MPTPNSKWTDWITDWMAFTEGAPTPESFRLWAAISAIGAAVERRVWVRATRRPLYANQYIWLVAPPGIGKFVIEEIRGMMEDATWLGEKAFRVAPDSVTKASLIDTLADSKRIFLPPSGSPETYASLYVCAEEASNFLPTYEGDFLGVLNTIWNNKSHHEERRRYGHAAKVWIDSPQLSMIWGVQPGWLATTFPEEAWTTGLTSRTVMVYASERLDQEPFGEEALPDSETRVRLVARLGSYARLWGQMQWTPQAAQVVLDWYRLGGPPIPSHSKLTHYLPRRRDAHAIKLCMVSALSRTGELVIEEPDARRAISWLLEAETTMPDVFRAMIGKTDVQMIQDLHEFLGRQYAKEKKAFPSRIIAHWFAAHAPADKVDKIWGLAEKAGYIARDPRLEDHWTVRPRHEHGVE